MSMELRYRCPVCDSLFSERWEAIACQKLHDVEEVHIWVCDYCGEVFEDIVDGMLHEEDCDKPTCLSCRHCTENRRRWHPCPRPSFDKEMEACDRYEKDRDTHVAHS